jgi:phosphatidylserine decarboxylase
MLYQLMRILPQNLLSYLTGAFVRIRFIEPLRTFFIWSFVKLFGIDLSEAVAKKFETIEDVFTREIDMAKRPMLSDFVSPADGIFVRGAKSHESRAVQVKGIDYSLKELFVTEDEIAWYATIYLAPHNYHRVHSPAAGKLVKIAAIPGRLWPVNPTFVGLVPKLFCQNERMLFRIELEGASDAHLHVAMVGAFNVGRMCSKHWPNIYTNTLVPAQVHGCFNIDIALGEELGVFMLGSTVVIGLNQKAYETLAPTDSLDSRPIQIGDSLVSVS